MNTISAGQRLGVVESRIRQLIGEGRLHATNVSLGTQRVRWDITEEDIQLFLNNRNQQITDLKEAKALHKEIVKERNEDDDKALLLEAQLTFMEMKTESKAGE